LYAWSKHLGQSLMEPFMNRIYTISNLVWKFHSSSRSSTKNSTLGQTLCKSGISIVLNRKLINCHLQFGQSWTQVDTDDLKGDMLAIEIPITCRIGGLTATSGCSSPGKDFSAKSRHPRFHCYATYQTPRPKSPTHFQHQGRGERACHPSQLGTGTSDRLAF